MVLDLPPQRIVARNLGDGLQQPRAEFLDADAVERDQFVAYGVGAAMVATGAVLLWLHSKDDAAVSATPLPEGGGLLGYSARW